jgi:hypothetical protein
MANEYMGDIPRLKVRHALVPITAVACFLLGLATTLREPAPTLALDEVVAMKPVEGSDGQPVFPKMPIEALYGVPSERTQHLWSPRKKKDSDTKLDIEIDSTERSES